MNMPGFSAEASLYSTSASGGTAAGLDGPTVTMQHLVIKASPPGPSTCDPTTGAINYLECLAGQALAGPVITIYSY